MRRLWFLMAALLAFGSIAVAAPGAGATAPAKPSAKFCAAVAKIGSSDTNNGDLTAIQAKAKALAKQYQNAAKAASGKVKKATNNIAKFLNSLSGKNTVEMAKLVTSNDFKTYMSSIRTFTTAAATCNT